MRESREALVSRGKPLFVTYDKAFALVKRFEAAVVAYAPELIVGVLRSGLIPALMLSQRLTVPVAFCACNRGDEKARLVDAPEISGKRILVVDDFSSTGNTLAKVVASLRSSSAEVKTLAIFYDEHLLDPPDFGHKAEHFIQFVWDKLEVTPSSRRLFESEDSRYAPDAVDEYFGIDVDGMILDQPGICLEKIRHHLADKKPEAIVLVTARAASEVQVALAGSGLGQFAIASAEELGLGRSHDNPVGYKAEQIRRRGISTFYEGNTEHALKIARACPITDVVLWNAGEPIRINVDEMAPT